MPPRRGRRGRATEVVAFQVELPASTTAAEVEAVALGERLYPGARRARGRVADRAAEMLDVVADRFRVSFAHDREGARDRGDRGRAQARQRPGQRLRGDAGGEQLWRFSTGPCTAPEATCATPGRSRRCSPSTRPTAPARPAAASAGSSASTSASSSPTTARPCATARSRRSRRRPGPRSRTTCSSTPARPAFRATPPGRSSPRRSASG